MSSFEMVAIIPSVGAAAGAAGGVAMGVAAGAAGAAGGVILGAAVGTLAVGAATAGAVIATGAVVAAGALSTVAVAAGAATGLVAAAGASVGATAYALYKTGVGTAKEINVLKNAAKEERKKYQRSLEIYKEQVKKNKQEEKKFVSKLQGTVSLCSLSIDIKPYVNSISDADELYNLNQINYYDTKLKELFFNAHQKNIVLDEQEDEMYFLAQELEKRLNKGKYSFKDVLNKYISLVEKSKKAIYVSEDKSHISEFGPLFFEVDNLLGEPTIGAFYNELREALEKPEETNNDDKILASLNEILKGIAEISSLIKNISCPSHELDSVNNLLNHTYDLMEDQEVSLITKYDVIAMHYHNLDSEYKRLLNKYGEKFDEKRHFDFYYLLYCHYCKILGEDPLAISFDFANASASTELAKKKCLEVEPKALEKERNELVMKTIRETMKRENHRLIKKQEKETPKGTLYEEIYHLENGNVIIYDVMNGELKYSVKGVHISGTNLDRQSILESMKNACKNKKKVYEALLAAGVNVQLKETLEPNIIDAEEIELKLGIEQKEFLYAQKVNRRKGDTVQERRMGD